MGGKSTVEFMSYLRGQGVKLWVEGTRLRCRVPEDVATPALRAELAQRKEDILGFLSRFGYSTLDPSPPIPIISREGELPLSFAQQRMWFGDQWEPGNPAFNILTAVRLTGPLDLAALEQSFNRVIERHEPLRTTFVAVDGRPLQVIAPAVVLSVPIVDLSVLPEIEREAETRRLAEMEVQWSFDLAHGPLVRASVLRLGREEHVLLLNIHHIVSDGWSSEVLLGEMVALYQGLAQGEAAELPELPIQYCDFAVWQRGWMQGEVLKRQLSYWKERLEHAPRMLELPTDRPRPPVRSYRGAQESFLLSSDLTRRLQTLSNDEETTLFMTLLAAFMVLLHRYTAQEDIVVGSPIANRNRAEIEGLIGFFVNTVVLRCNLAGNPSFRELMTQVREVTLGAYAHQDLPFEMLVDELQVERDLSSVPLFQVMMVLQNAPRPYIVEAGPSFSLLDIDSKKARTDLVLSMTETELGLVGTLVYSTDLFDRATALRQVEHFRILLEAIVADPDQGVAEVQILPMAERRQVLAEWSRTGSGRLEERRAHELVELQAGQRPDAVAVVQAELHLTYGELDRRANRLAHHLIEQGLGAEDVAPILMDRSAEMIVSQLAVLKAGGAYVPLEPVHPEHRLAFMIDDASAPVILTSTSLLQYVPQTRARPVLADRIAGDRAAGGTQSPGARTGPEQLAYVIYTSGSTGRPKGVMCLHKGLTNLVEWYWQEYGIDQADRVTQVASAGFDASLCEIWPCLACGATLCIVDNETRQDPDELLRYLVESQATISFMPTPLAEVFLQIAGGADLSLRFLLTGGDKLSTFADPDLGFALSNIYGPTENTVASTTAHAVRSADHGSVPPIGRPIQGVQAYVVDDRLSPTPIGVPGELCVGGDSLTRGYLNRPGLTGERFIPDPFCEEPGCRLYRTGDLVRYLPDGSLEFLERLDHQVKVRGYRIELGEIEAVLGEHPGVSEAVALARQEQGGDRRLVAYIVSREGKGPAAGELRGFLLDRLPEYMVPSAFVQLEVLPLTPSGKVDRESLLASGELGLDPAEERIEPRDALELRLVQIWEDVLDTRPIGVQHSFFEIGGHSLLAVQVLARVERELGRKLPLVTLFQAATIEQLAAVLRREPGPAGSSGSLVTIRGGEPGRRPLFLVHPAGGNVLCYVDLARRLETGQPCFGLEATGLDGEQPQLTEIEEMASHCLGLIRSEQPEGPYLLGGWSSGGLVAFEIAQQLHDRGEEVALLALVDSYAPAEGRQADPDDITLLAALAGNLGLQVDRISFDRESLQRLEPDQRLQHVLEAAKRGDLVPPDLELAQLRGIFDAFKSSVLAARAYRPRSYPGSITLFKASERSSEPGEHHGWSRLAEGNLTVHEIVGDHYSIAREPAVRAVADEINQSLRRLREP